MPEYSVADVKIKSIELTGHDISKYLTVDKATRLVSYNGTLFVNDCAEASCSKTLNIKLIAIDDSENSFDMSLTI